MDLSRARLGLLSALSLLHCAGCVLGVRRTPRSKYLNRSLRPVRLWPTVGFLLS